MKIALSLDDDTSARAIPALKRLLLLVWCDVGCGRAPGGNIPRKPHPAKDDEAAAPAGGHGAFT